MKSFQAFLENIKEDDEYIIVYNRDNNKSDIWSILLILRYGPRFLKSIYKDPIDIIDISKISSQLSRKPIYLFCDDCISSHMMYNINDFILKVQRVNIVCAVISNKGIDKFNKYNVIVYYSRVLKSVKEIIESNSIYNLKTIKNLLNSELEQPYIDKINYMDNLIVYFEHKMPDIKLSFPKQIIRYVNNCNCAHSFYKIINLEKGALDIKNEKTFIQNLYNRFHL